MFMHSSLIATGHLVIVRLLILKTSAILSQQTVYFVFEGHAQAFAIVQVIYYFIVEVLMFINGIRCLHLIIHMGML